MSPARGRTDNGTEIKNLETVTEALYRMVTFNRTPSPGGIPFDGGFRPKILTYPLELRFDACFPEGRWGP